MTSGGLPEPSAASSATIVLVLRGCKGPRFVCQKSRLSSESAGEPRQFSVRTDNAMAWHDNGQWIPAVRRPHRSTSFRCADRFCQVQVAPGLAIRNFFQSPPYLVFKIASPCLERKIEMGPGAVEVFSELSLGLAQDRMARFKPRRIVPLSLA